MDTPSPSDLNNMLHRILAEGRPKDTESTVLKESDDEYLRSLLKDLHSGEPAIVIVSNGDEGLRYLFSSASRAKAAAMLGRVIARVGDQLSDSGDDLQPT